MFSFIGTVRVVIQWTQVARETSRGGSAEVSRAVI